MRRCNEKVADPLVFRRISAPSVVKKTDREHHHACLAQAPAPSLSVIHGGLESIVGWSCLCRTTDMSVGPLCKTGEVIINGWGLERGLSMAGPTTFLLRGECDRKRVRSGRLFANPFSQYAVRVLFQTVPGWAKDAINYTKFNSSFQNIEGQDKVGSMIPAFM